MSADKGRKAPKLTIVQPGGSGRSVEAGVRRSIWIGSNSEKAAMREEMARVIGLQRYFRTARPDATRTRQRGVKKGK